MAASYDYCSFFDLNEAPFRLSPDPSFFFPARPHLAAIEVLKFAIHRGEGFMVLLGPAGTGKTLLLRLLLNELGEDKVSAVVVTPAVSPTGLLRLLLDEVDCPVDSDDQELGTLLKRFQAALLELAARGKELLIVVDEAQCMPSETLEQLRLLSNLETDRRKLLQILLIGQTELDELLQDSKLGQLTQRIVVREELHPLSRKETSEYVNFRLTKAGRADLGLSPSAVKRLYKASGGIPRLINRAMDRALLMAAAAGARHVRPVDITDAQETLPRPWTRAEGMGLRAGRAVLLYGVAVAVAAGGLWWGQSGHRLQLGSVLKTGTEAPGQQPKIAKTALANMPVERVRVKVGHAFVRKGPDRSYDPVAVVDRDQELAVVTRSGGWRQVEFRQTSGQRDLGWIYHGLVEDMRRQGNEEQLVAR